MNSQDTIYYAEQALVGSIMFEPRVLNDLAWLEANHFDNLKCSLVYTALRDLFRRGESVDELTLSEELAARGVLNDVGGAAFIAELLNATPTHVHYLTYASIVRSAAHQRDLMQLAGDLATAVSESNRDNAVRAIAAMQSIITEPDDPVEEMSRFLVPSSELKNLPRVTWLIPGEVPERGAVVVYGPSGVGKSFFVVDLAMFLSQTKSVIYIAAEGENGFASRVEAWCKHHKRPHGRLQFYLNIIDLLDDIERNRFIKLIAGLHPDLVIVDTMSLCMLPGDENSTRDMGLFMKACKAIRTALKAATLLVHHTGKEGKQERGNSSLRAASDVMIRLTGDDDVIAIECSKSKDARPFPTRYMKLRPVELPDGESSPVIIAAEKVIQTKLDPLTPRQQDVINALGLATSENGVSTLDLAEITDMARGAVLRCTSKLIQLGLVVIQQGSTPLYLLTKEGRLRLTADSSRLTADSLDLSSDSSDSPDSLTHSMSHDQISESDESGESVSQASQPSPILSIFDLVPEKRKTHYSAGL